MRQVHGIWLPLVTPFEGNDIDFDGLLQYYGQTNLHGVLIGGTTGEGHALNVGELHRLARRACDVLKPNMKVLLGVHGNATADVVEKIRACENLPVDGLLVASPAYIRPSQDGLHRHFENVAAATGHDVILYNIPYRTAVNLTNDTVCELAAIPNVVAVKDCCGSPEQSADLLANRPPKLAVLTGEDRHLLTSLMSGADGAICACAHVAPFDVVNIYNRLAANDDRTAKLAFDRLSGIIDILFCEPNPMPLKYWLYREGLIRSPDCRLPLTSVSHALAERINAYMEGSCPAHRHYQISTRPTGSHER